MQGNPFGTKTRAVASNAGATGGKLALALAIQRICRRARAEGKTMVRAATLREMERQVKRLRAGSDTVGG